MTTYNLNRFHEAQKHHFDQAYAEILNGRKTNHWMWFIFPQIAGLGFSETASHYAIRDISEADLYLNEAVLGSRLIRISNALLEIKDSSAAAVFGYPDDLKLKSSMTLFNEVKNSDPVFQKVLKHFFDGKKDEKTLSILKRMES